MKVTAGKARIEPSPVKQLVQFPGNASKNRFIGF